MLDLSLHSRAQVCTVYPKHHANNIVLSTHKKSLYQVSWRILYKCLCEVRKILTSFAEHTATGALGAQAPNCSHMYKKSKLEAVAYSCTTVQSLLSSTKELQGHQGNQ